MEVYISMHYLFKRLLWWVEERDLTMMAAIKTDCIEMSVFNAVAEILCLVEQLSIC